MKTPLAVLALTFLLSSHLPASDWPQWLGPSRNGVWPEEGVLTTFPADGLKVKWRQPIGHGYAGPAIVQGRIYVMDYQVKGGKVSNNPGGRSLLNGEERILCLEASTGKLLWKHEYEQPYNISYAGGPRCTPAVADGKVYALGAEGKLTCLDAAKGTVVWEKDFKKEYKVRTQVWGNAAHPLVDQGTVYCLVGGDDQVVVALDAATGKEKWKALSSKDPGYCPPIMITHGGKKQLIVWHPQSLNGLNPENGEAYWSLPLKPAYDLPSSTPQKSGNHLYVSAIGSVGALIELDSSKPGAEVVWKGTPKNAVYCSNTTPLIHDGVIYGCDIESSALIAVRLKDGERLWETKAPTLGEGGRGRHGTAFLVRNGDRYFMFNEKGDLILAHLTPEGYKEISRQHLLKPTNEAFGRKVVWSHPAFANKSMVARNDEEIICVDLSP